MDLYVSGRRRCARGRFHPRMRFLATLLPGVACDPFPLKRTQIGSQSRSASGVRGTSRLACNASYEPSGSLDDSLLGLRAFARGQAGLRCIQTRKPFHSSSRPGSGRPIARFPLYY
jgi:hypothetical protein